MQDGRDRNCRCTFSLKFRAAWSSHMQLGTDQSRNRILTSSVLWLRWELFWEVELFSWEVRRGSGKFGGGCFSSLPILVVPDISREGTEGHSGPRSFLLCSNNQLTCTTAQRYEPHRRDCGNLNSRREAGKLQIHRPTAIYSVEAITSTQWLAFVRWFEPFYLSKPGIQSFLPLSFYEWP